MKLGLRIATAGAAALCLVGMAACGNAASATDTTPATNTSTVTVTSTVQQPTTVTVTATPTESKAPTVAPGGHCTLADLNISLGEANGAAGSTYFPLTFTNTSFQPCSLTGFPKVSYVAGDDNHQVGGEAAQNGTAGPAVMLTPGKSASADLQEVVVMNFPDNVCTPTAVKGLRVSLPGDTAAAFVPQQNQTGCAAKTLPGGQFQMSVQAISTKSN
ncbi:MAG: DUF4232 domain-containing protein [Nakamurella sp.]